MNKIKVFYLVYALTSGGIERYSVNLYKHLDKTDIQIDFIVKSSKEQFFDEQFRAAGGRKIPIERESKIASLLNAFKVAKNGYNVAYFNLSKPSSVFKYPLICRLAGIKKIIIHSHNSSDDEKGLRKKIVNWAARKYINMICTAKLACSDKAAMWMFGEQGMEDYILIKNGIEVEKYSYDILIRKKIRRELRCRDNTVVLGHIGRFVEQKNHGFLLEIFENYLKLNPNSKLILIGIGPHMHDIEGLVRSKGIEEKVVFLGEKDNVNEYMQAMDAFLLPSLYEGLPVAGVEAQAAGLKCFFSDVITRDAQITDNVEYISLNKGAAYWAESIKNGLNYERKKQDQNIIDSGFDIDSTAQKVRGFLLR